MFQIGSGILTSDSLARRYFDVLRKALYRATWVDGLRSVGILELTERQE